VRRPAQTMATPQLTMQQLEDRLKDRLLFAVPKKGRLYEHALDLLKGADIEFTRSQRVDVCVAHNHPIALVFLPACDIPPFVGSGHVDLGITGQDRILESQMSDFVTEVLKLDFGHCKLQVQVPNESPIQTVKELAGKRVTTSYPAIASEYFGKVDESVGLTESQRTQIRFIAGSVESSCTLGLADGIIDIVESGETMRAAGLRPIATVSDSEAVLITSSTPKHPHLAPLMQQITSRIAGFIASKQFVLCKYNIPQAKLHDATAITPGRRAPTVSVLEDENWRAVSALIERKNMATIMDQLVDVGASEVLIVTLYNCRV